MNCIGRAISLAGESRARKSQQQVCDARQQHLAAAAPMQPNCIGEAQQQQQHHFDLLTGCQLLEDSTKELHRASEQQFQHFHTTQATQQMHTNQQQQQAQHLSSSSSNNNNNNSHHFPHLQQDFLLLGSETARGQPIERQQQTGGALDDELQSAYWSDSTSLSESEKRASSRGHSSRQRSSRARSSKSAGRSQTSSSEAAQCTLPSSSAATSPGQPQTGSGGGGGQIKRKRHMANERERERTKSLNEALEILRNKLPVTEAEKRSKIQTLRTAKEFIQYLVEVELKCEPNLACPSGAQSQQSQPPPPPPPQQQQFKSLQVNANNAANYPQTEPNQSHPPAGDQSLAYKFYKFRHARKPLER